MVLGHKSKHSTAAQIRECGLRCTKSMRVEEMVAMFLYVVSRAVGNQVLQERFQYSGKTISRHFHAVLHSCLRLAIKYIKLQDPTFRLAPPKL